MIERDTLLDPDFLIAETEMYYRSMGPNLGVAKVSQGVMSPTWFKGVIINSRLGNNAFVSKFFYAMFHKQNFPGLHACLAVTQAEWNQLWLPPSDSHTVLSTFFLTL